MIVMVFLAYVGVPYIWISNEYRDAYSPVVKGCNYMNLIGNTIYARPGIEVESPCPSVILREWKTSGHAKATSEEDFKKYYRYSTLAISGSGNQLSKHHFPVIAMN